MTYRVGIVGVFHETNTFSHIATDLAAFAPRWNSGDALRLAFAGTRTVVGGFLDAADRLGWEVVPIFGAYATPSGPVTTRARQAIGAALTAAITAAVSGKGPLDGLLLELHGAMAAEDGGDPEEEIVASIRAQLPTVPISATLDLHANLGHPRLSGITLLTGYRTNPHIDTFDSGHRSAHLLAALLSGEIDPVRVSRGIPVISAPIAQRTDMAPLLDILQRARELERAERLLDVTVHAGYAYADVPHLGMGVSVTADVGRRAAAEQVADQLAALIWQRRNEFRVSLPTPAAAFTQAAATPGPTAVVDTGDNINAGTPGDSTWLLSEALAAAEVSVLATICDAEVVAAAVAAGPGRRLVGPLGGRSGKAGGEPLMIDAEVVTVSDGTFVNKGPMATGATVSMGAAAVLRAGACDIVVQQRPVQPNDPELFRCMGLRPEDYQVVLLKGASAVRAGWAGTVSGFIDSATPGLSDSRIEGLEFRRAPRPLWPLNGDEAGQR